MHNVTQCGKTNNSLFCQEIHESHFFLGKLQKRWFDEIFFLVSEFFVIPHCVLRMFVCHVVLYDTSIEPITTKEFHKSPKHQTLNCDRLVIY